jgi:TM2 domain-containing membrane protein YozV
MKCPFCNAEIEDHLIFCPSCGARLHQEDGQAAQPAAGNDQYANGQQYGNGQYANGQQYGNGQYANGQQYGNGQYANGQQYGNGQYANGQQYGNGQYANGQQYYGNGQYAGPQYYQQPCGPDPMWPARSKMAAGILAILLGDLGVHKFYMGKIGMGILYLVFCWTGVPAIIGLVEGIIYLTSSRYDFEMKNHVRCTDPSD